ncbi:uncharacterized protein LOC123008428 [Tribolium madens]|uniref:uncharacterized protein LOC123008428 n=1 Tax=Tribolium madens TaxID=41895 RepID=UPI001CF728EE|nr:uncharacterized protein LOC123008428 [Tribolium madens]
MVISIKKSSKFKSTSPLRRNVVFGIDSIRTHKMAARFAFVFLAALVVFQVLMWESCATVIRRDVADAPKTAEQTIEDTLQSFKSSLDDLVKNIQNNELVQNVSVSLKSLSEQIQTQGQQLVAKLQNSTKTN